MAQQIACPTKATMASSRQRTLHAFSIPFVLLILTLSDFQGCLAHGSHGHVRLRGLQSVREGKHLYCKHSGGCSQCQESEEINRYCADTGYKEILRCTTNEKHADSSPVVLTYPYPSDVHIDDDEDPGPDPDDADPDSSLESGSEARSRSRSGMIRVVRSCTENTVAAHVQALAADVAEAEARGGGQLGGHMGLFNFELLMVLLLGLALPVVYWRKIRIRHL